MASPSRIKTATILCVDDEPKALSVRRLLLESAGYQVATALSGEEGIQIFKSQAVDAVIMDYWLLGMDGIQTARELKRINPAIPIIVLSALTELPGESIGAADRWFLKGDDPAYLLNAIKTMLESRS
ncbi:MAG TPA: response regulator [Candidatus Sulfotelmatobacter sp.]|jgi:two-component system copper resistance phosphate regulon response regulator CusR|nr:response regulator [Candidatus Sulfotelmatobacter sp.]